MEKKSKKTNKSEKDELEELLGSTPDQLDVDKDSLPAIVDDNLKTLRAEVALFMQDEIVHHGNRKFSDKDIVQQWLYIYEYVLDNPAVLTMEQFYDDNLTPKIVTSGSLRKASSTRQPPLAESIKTEIKVILEGRIWNGALHNKLNPAVSIFLLKNNYGKVDKKEHDVNVSDKFKYTIPVDDDDIEDIDDFEDLTEN